jgi:hypothetical protein
VDICAPVTLLILDDEIIENADLVSVETELLG